MVPLVERITTVSVSITSLPNCTPRSMRPSVTPVAPEQAFAFDHVFDLVFTPWIFDAHFGGSLALLFGVEHQPRLHLSADAAQRRGR